MTAFLNPPEIIKNLKLQKDMIAADFGSGSGGWVLPLAKILEEGQIFALDILEEPLSALRAKAKTDKISNIDTLLANVEKGTSLLNNSCDLVLMTNLLWQCDNKKFVLEEGKRVLKSSGQLLIIDWQADTALGPKNTISPNEVKTLAGETGLKLISEFSAGPFHYGLLFQK